MTKAERRKIIVKRVAARKIRAYWARRRAARASPVPKGDDFGGVPETDAALDELPDSLVG